MPKVNDGKLFEGKVKNALQAFCNTYPAFYHRFPDTHAARGWLPAQPSDFLWAIPTDVFLLECKSTDKGEPIWRLLDDGQLGKHRLWHRAGHPSLFLYADLHTKATEVWGGVDIVQFAHARKRPVEPILTGTMDNIAQLLTQIYNPTEVFYADSAQHSFATRDHTLH